MIQYYLDLEKQVKAITEIHLEYGQIQKIYSTAFFISFAIRTPGKTWHIYVGRGGGYEGVWFHEKAPESVIRRRDGFLEYLRSHISSCSLVSIEIDKLDRIVSLNYHKFGRINSILFFWKARKLYFLHHFIDTPEGPQKLLLSWHGKLAKNIETKGNLFEYFNEVGRREGIDHTIKSNQFKNIDELLQLEKNIADSKGSHFAPNFLERKLKNIEEDLSRAKQWKLLQQTLDENKNLEQLYELKIADQKVKFEGLLNSFERRNIVFEKIKKLKKGEAILTGRLEETKKLLAGKIKTIISVKIPIIRPVWGRDVNELKIIKSLVSLSDDYKIINLGTYSIGVGLSSQGNDQLRNKWASKEDTWIHLEGFKSAHAIIKLHVGSVCTNEMLAIAASIVAYFSHFSDEWIPIIHTLVKNLKGVSGSPGMVIYKKEKHLKCYKVETQIWLKD